MKVPLLDLGPQLETIESELKQAVLEVIGSTRYIGGPKVDELEAAVAAYVGAEHGVGVTSGTDALLVSLMALNVGSGDIVITTPYTFFATAGAVARLNATPAFVDIDPDTYNMDPAALDAWFDDHSADRDKVKAIIPVHLYGQCADMDRLLEVAGRYGVPVIEDAAQAIGASYPGKDGLRKAGSMGISGCFSFFPSKNLGGIGDGGMVVSNDAAFAEKVRQLRNHGAEPKYYHATVGGNFRLDAIQAAALSVKLKHLDEWHGMRQKNAAHYDAHLDGPGLKKPALVYDRSCHIYNQYIVSVPERRDELRAHLTARDIGNEIYYPVSLHDQACFDYLGYSSGQFPNSEEAARKTIALPIYPELTTEMLDYVVAAFAEFYA
ncbi:MAG: DegT/DnrJ/EryC1/StrS family aminotransferase [bacterium]|nr:DegT/DnrJ/EryC1/StrS family aminotransferase [bacterium]